MSNTLRLEPTDEWNRPRCQQIGTYVDADEDYQCALVAGHEGSCDPLPEIPDSETPEAIRLAVDVVLFGEFDGAIYVLLIERGWEPFKGSWALPGGHVDAGEDTADAAYRELTEETGISVGALAYVGAYGAVGRDPRGRYVTFAYSGRMAHRLEPTAGDDAVKAEWVRIDRIFSGEVPLAFDHAEIVRDALRVTPLYGA